MRKREDIKSIALAFFFAFRAETYDSLIPATVSVNERETGLHELCLRSRPEKTAMPPDVRKAFGLPGRVFQKSWATPRFGRSPSTQANPRTMIFPFEGGSPTRRFNIVAHADGFILHW